MRHQIQSNRVLYQNLVMSTQKTSETFTWIIENFSDFTTTFGRTFSLSANPNVKFYIELYQNGIDGHLTNYVLIKLNFEKSDKNVDEAQIELTLTRNDGSRFKILEGTLLRHTSGYTYSFPFSLQTNVYRNYLTDANNGLLTNGKLIINCQVVYDFQKGRNEESSSQSTYSYVELEQLQTDFKTMLVNADFSDVVFCVGDKEFALHKNILGARSPVFKTMFHSQFSESEKNRVEIPDVSAEVFEEFVRYIYCGAVPEMKKYALELFMIADKYQLESLKTLCGESLGRHLSIETASNILLLADMYNEGELKCKCMEFISQNSKQVRTTEGWKEILKAKRIDLLNELIEQLEL